MEQTEQTEQRIKGVQVNVHGLRRIKRTNVNFLFDDIKKSKNVEELFWEISRCNNKIQSLNIFEGEPVIKLRRTTETDVEVNYIIKERNNNYVIGTNVNNRGEVTGDFEVHMPYIFKSINSIEFKSNISSLYTNNFAIRFLIPQISKKINFNLILEANLSNINNTQHASYMIKTNSFKTILVNQNHTLIWDISYNTIFHKICKNFIPSDFVLKIPGNYIKHSLRHVYKNNQLRYDLPALEKCTNESVHLKVGTNGGTKGNIKGDSNPDDQGGWHGNPGQTHTNYPTSGYFYQVENEISLPFCECNFFRNHFHYLFVKRLSNKMFTYMMFTNGIKHDFNKANPYHLGAFHFSGSIGSSLTFRGFEHNSIGNTDVCYKFNRKKRDYEINYNYLGSNFITSFQLVFKYILNFQNINPILFFYVQLGRLSNQFFSSFNQLKNDTRVSVGIGFMTYIQRNVSLELFFNYPLLHQLTDRTKYFQVGLNFKGML
ncbi:sorting assembly machinery 50 kDa subunit [Plasmodium gonderi]|uniref:Sorting assembly machinery 50 kDa subunit n=1 Tax=Plasmodium gonderi TaxID=77519 RepID=A0A1Y1JL50_PLAGO|nr:sorting assembly machinery 50 kDa subunit [Plasmodium gonderi]GAW81937.1 sorting assembly machinery 50 kDa subunit [Plasmodium gonderi]